MIEVVDLRCSGCTARTTVPCEALAPVFVAFDCARVDELLRTQGWALAVAQRLTPDGTGYTLALGALCSDCVRAAGHPCVNL